MSGILILTASFGEGHNAAARNLREAIQAASPETPVAICDIYRDTYGWFNELTKQAYLGLINHAPGVWKIAFDLLDHTPWSSGRRSSTGSPPGSFVASSRKAAPRPSYRLFPAAITSSTTPIAAA